MPGQPATCQRQSEYGENESEQAYQHALLQQQRARLKQWGKGQAVAKLAYLQLFNFQWQRTIEQRIA
jgi:hypothetical protein